MSEDKQHLGPREAQLVAVGAGVGAGCQPCLSHHLKKGAEAGLDDEQLLAAVASGERVAAEAAVAIGDHTRTLLGEDVTPAWLSRLEEAFASLGAALGANDLINIDRQLRAAAGLGASRAQLQQAIETAHGVQENAARIHRREAERLLAALAPEPSASEVEAPCGCGHEAPSEATPAEPVVENESDTTTASEPGDGCGCGDATEATAREAEAAKVEATPSGQLRGCGDVVAAHIAAAGPSAAMDGCRQMFVRFRGGATDAAEDEAPATAAPAGARRKEG